MKKGLIAIGCLFFCGCSISDEQRIQAKQNLDYRNEKMKKECKDLGMNWTFRTDRVICVLKDN